MVGESSRQPIRLSALAQSDITAILRWSEDEFGTSARERYAALIGAALRDLQAHPHGTGSQERPELGAGVLSYHLHFSRRHVPVASGVVRRPRHLLLYRIEPDGAVAVARLLHDSMELARHLPQAGECAD